MRSPEKTGPNASDARVELQERQLIHEGFLTLARYRVRHRRYDGEWSEPHWREVCERKQAAAVLLYDAPRNVVVLIEQFRLPALIAGLDPWMLEVVAGLIDDAKAESPDGVVHRESREEANLEVEELWPIARFMPSQGGCDEIVQLYLGRVDSREAGGIHGLAHEHEDIRVCPIPLPEALALVDRGKIENATALIALLWLARHREEVRRRWGA